MREHAAAAAGVGMLYLLKGSRVREYHQQNLAILGAPDGDTTETIYNRRWVAPDLDLSVGAPGVIVFADSPYETFVPVRFCMLDEVEETEERIRVVARLGPFTAPDGFDLLNARWVRFDRDDPGRPGRRFLFEDDNPGLLQPTSIAGHDEAWRRCCSALRANGYFERSTIARIRGVSDERGVDVELQHPVGVGTMLQVEIETCTPTAERDSVDLVVESEPPGVVIAVDEPQLPANGTATVSIEAVAPGPARIRCSLLPEPARSSRPTLSLAVVAASAGAPPVLEHRGTDDHLLLVPGPELSRLVSQLRRDATIGPGAWLALFDDYFGVWGDAQPQVRSAHAQAAYDAGAYARAALLLRVLERRTPEEDLHLLLAGLRAGERVELEPLLDTLDLNADRQFGELLDALDGVDGASLSAITRALSDSVLGEDKLLRLLDRVFSRLTDVELSCDLAEELAYADLTRGASQLMARWPDPAQMPHRALDLIIDWEAEPRRLGPYLLVGAERAVASGDWPAIKSIVDKGRRTLSGAERNRVLLFCAEALLESGDADRGADGFVLMQELVEDLAGRGELDAAVRHTQALLGYAAVRSDASLRSAAEQMRDRVAEAVEASDQLAEWRAMRADGVAQRCAAHLQGKVLHLVGGKAEPWQHSLANRLGLASLRWHETEKGENPSQQWTKSITAERDVVVVLWERIGHAISNPVQQKCQAAGVLQIEARISENDILEQLDRHLNGEGKAEDR